LGRLRLSTGCGKRKASSVINLEAAEKGEKEILFEKLKKRKKERASSTPSPRTPEEKGEGILFAGQPSRKGGPFWLKAHKSMKGVPFSIHPETRRKGGDK